MCPLLCLDVVQHCPQHQPLGNYPEPSSLSGGPLTASSASLLVTTWFFYPEPRWPPAFHSILSDSIMVATLTVLFCASAYLEVAYNNRHAIAFWFLPGRDYMQCLEVCRRPVFQTFHFLLVIIGKIASYWVFCFLSVPITVVADNQCEILITEIRTKENAGVFWSKVYSRSDRVSKTFLRSLGAAVRCGVRRGARGPHGQRVRARPGSQVIQTLFCTLC